MLDKRQTDQRRVADFVPHFSFFVGVKLANVLDSASVALQTSSTSGVPRGDAMPTFRAPAQLSRAMPVICPTCGGRAPLIRMSPDSFTRGKMEIWTYECSACGLKVQKTVAPDSMTS